MCGYMDECKEYVPQCNQIDNSDLEEAPSCFIEDEPDDEPCPHCHRIDCECSDFDIDPDMGAH